MIKAILCVLLLTLLPIPAQSQPVKTTMPPGWLAYVKACAEKYGIDPYDCLGVAGAESSIGEVEFRFGKMGKTYYGPFGIHKCFLKKWQIDDPYVNTEVGIRALARYKNLRQSLKKYNTEFNEGYYKRVIYLAKKYRRAELLE